MTASTKDLIALARHRASCNSGFEDGDAFTQLADALERFSAAQQAFYEPNARLSAEVSRLTAELAEVKIGRDHWEAHYKFQEKKTAIMRAELSELRAQEPVGEVAGFTKEKLGSMCSRSLPIIDWKGHLVVRGDKLYARPVPAAQAVPGGLIEYLQGMLNQCNEGWNQHIPEMQQQAKEIRGWLEQLAVNQAPAATPSEDDQWEHAKFVQRVLEAGNSATEKDRADAYWMVREFRQMAHVATKPPSEEIADAARVLEWMRSPNRKPAQMAFTAGPERQAAYWIEVAQGEAKPSDDGSAMLFAAEAQRTAK